MADINVERKSGSIWPWILGALALLLLLWLLFGLLDNDDEVETAVAPAAEVAVPLPGDTAAMAAAPAVTPGAIPAELQSYMTTCTDQGGTPQGDMGLQHTYTANCLQGLAGSLDAITTQQAVANTDVSQKLQTMRQHIDQLQASGAQNTNHANLTRDAMSAANDVMTAMRTAYFSAESQVGSAIDEVQQAFSSIQPGIPMLDQRDAVQRYFQEAGEALQTMAERRPAM